MNTRRAAIFLIAIGCGGAAIRCAAQSTDYPLRPVPAHRVQLRDSFWRPRLETNRTVTIPTALQICEQTGRIENFKVAAGTSSQPWTGRFGFNDSDISKVVEGAAYSLMSHPDAALESYLDEVIGHMAAAQEDDGYLSTAWTARDKIDNPDDVKCYPQDEKWLGSFMSHELYNLGHMYESATAHRQATGKSNFLEVATSSADLLVATFGPDGLEMPPGHPEIELGLVKLYRTTGDRRYLELAKYFLDVRGTPTDDRPELWGAYCQDHRPLREQAEAVGHAVRAGYLYAAATDVAAITGDRPLADAVDRLWQNVVGKKLYLTGGIGARHEGESFGANYELPNRTAYCETCAGIAMCYWAHRMFLFHGDAQYIDVLERSLYNNVLAGVSLGGKEFFYPNPLASQGDDARSQWFDCSCCPTNLCRFIPSVPGYAYATDDDRLYVNLFAAGTAELELASGRVQIEQQTRYPWEGSVEMSVRPAAEDQQFALHVRLPGWACGQVVPSDLYSFLDRPDENTASARLRLNGTEIAAAPDAQGYLVVDRAWQSGDTLAVELPMPVRRVVAHEQVAADRGRVALQRGPIVFCIEQADLDQAAVSDLVLPDDAPLASEFRPNLLGGVQVVTGAAQAAGAAAAGDLSFAAVPYFAWAHRDPGEMAVWLPRTAESGDRQHSAGESGDQP